VDLPGVPPSEDDEEDKYYPVRVEPAAHHLLLCDALEKVERREIRRMMVLMPPGSAKSSYASVAFPPWFLGRKPNRSIICTSYGSELPKKFGRRCRNIIQTSEYEAITGQLLTGDNSAADNWSLTNGSEYMAAGILAGITGNRADGLIIDDPIKGREAADSLTIRDKTWEAYTSNLRTRLKPNGFIVLILTRWHEDDPAGRILPDDWNGESGWITAKDGERWYVLCLQAECESEDDLLGRTIGEYIWPEWFPVEFFQQEKISQGSRNWNSLFQQRPAPNVGNIFKKFWWRFWYPKGAHPNPVQVKLEDGSFVACEQTELPDKFDRQVQSWDMAFKDAEDSSYVVGQVWGQKEAEVFLLDQNREKLDLPDTCKAVRSMSLKWILTRAKWIEDKANGPAVIQTLRKNVPGLISINPEGDKVARANATTPYIQAGNVYLPHPACCDWVAEFLSEATVFPNGIYDDQVDAMTQAIIKLFSGGSGARASTFSHSVMPD